MQMIDQLTIRGCRWEGDRSLSPASVTSSNIVQMWLWLWHYYLPVLGYLCILGFTSIPKFSSAGFGASCSPWDAEPFTTIGLIGDHIGVYPEFMELIVNANESWTYRLDYWWENITLLIPDPQTQEWKDLGLVDEIHEKGCKLENSKTLCPRIRQFLKHHLVDGSLREGRKRKTKAGNKIWRETVGGKQYLYPGALKILNRREHVNGEMILIEKPLLGEPRAR